MKKNKHVFAVGSLMLLIFIAASALIFYHSNKQIQKGYLDSEGKAAENFAVLTAANIKLTGEQVENLKNYSYSELMASHENRVLAQMMSNSNFATKVDYAYIMVHLKDDEVKYRVTEENQDRFDAPVGTKLDIMWLLDVNVSEDAASNELNDSDDELTRYSYYIDEDSLIFGEAPTYIYNSSEWGDHICGYSPIYSTDGSYIGVVGVELQVGDYSKYCGRAIKALGTLIAVTLLLFTLFFLYIYRQYKLIQMEKIYTDVLTGLGNRTFYNDLFIKNANSRSRRGHNFAMILADVDLFKRVNDTFGHEVGDAVLIELGQILLKVFDPKQIVRLGGEEFAVGMWIENEEALKNKLDELFTEVSSHKFSKQELTVSISAGACYYPAENVNGWLTSGMLRAADYKLYECKENGRNQYRIELFDKNKNYKKS